jgi:hypothetical protein
LGKLLLVGQVDLDAFDLLELLQFPLGLGSSGAVGGIAGETPLDEGDEFRGVAVVVGDEVLLVDR